MDIHRCRFVPYEAAGINVVAFSHPHLARTDKHSHATPVRLAIGRANGDIEIWNPWQGTWMQELIIAGGKKRSVEGLAWVVEEDEELENGTVVPGRMRLFSIGYTNTVTEWDLERACARRHASGQHGEIWCLAAQPKSRKASSAGQGLSQRIVGGTVDGSLVLYSTEDDDLRFQRMCRTHKSGVRVVCLAFQSRHVAVAGCADATIRVFDLRNGSMLHALTLGRDLSVRTKTAAHYYGSNPKELIVWSVCCLANGDIVSGDSTGQICIWDGRTYTQAQRIQAHREDILSLTTSADGSAIVSGGMDRRIVLYHQMEGHANRWAKVWHRRYPRHDVKTLAAFEGKGMSVVVAGGPDATPFVLPLQKSGLENHRALSHLPQNAPLISAPAARLAVCWWGRSVYIWTFDASVDKWIAKQETGAGPDGDIDIETGADAADAENLNPDRRLIGRIALNGDAFVTSAAISADGSLLVVATSTAVRAFELRRVNGTDADSQCRLVISCVYVPAAVAGGSGSGGSLQGAKETQGATRVAVSPDGRWVSVARGFDGFVTMLETHVKPIPDRHGNLHDRIVFRRQAERKHPRLRRVDRSAVIPSYQSVSGLGHFDRRIAHMVFSPDSRMLATADLAGFVDTWILSEADAAAGQENHAQNGDGLAFPDDSSSDSESDQDEDGDAGHYGDAPDRWIRNPRAEQLPKLSGAPVVFSFAPDVPGQPAVAGVSVDGSGSSGESKKTKATKKGKGAAVDEVKKSDGQAAAVADDYVLLAIVARSRFYALNPLRARFVPWHRRLAPASLPMEFRNILDLAKGVVWQGPRAWVYGPSYVFMLDTSMDRSRDEDEVQVVGGGGEDRTQKSLQNGGATHNSKALPAPPIKKRKREPNTGAGGRMTDGNLEPERIMMTLPGDGQDWVDVTAREEPKVKGMDDDDDEDDASSESSEDSISVDGEQQEQQEEEGDYQDAQTAQKRRAKKQLQKLPKDRAQRQDQKDQKKHTRWWLTFKYRSILGIVPLSSPTSAVAAYPPLEVAVIERPVWDADLPVRYLAEHK